MRRQVPGDVGLSEDRVRADDQLGADGDSNVSRDSAGGSVQLPREVLDRDRAAAGACAATATGSRRHIPDLVPRQREIASRRERPVAAPKTAIFQGCSLSRAGTRLSVSS